MTTTAIGPARVRWDDDQAYEDLVEVSAALYKKALTDLPPDVRSAVRRTQDAEVEAGARRRLEVMVEAISVSDESGIIVCQDTGLPVFKSSVGTDAAHQHRTA